MCAALRITPQQLAAMTEEEAYDAVHRVVGGKPNRRELALSVKWYAALEKA